MKDPERHLSAANLRFPCLVNPGRTARIEPGLRAMLNHEIFYFSDAAAMRRFLGNPLRYVGSVTDPVSRARFQPTRSSPRVVYQGRAYYFQSAVNRRTFQAIPETYANRKGA